VILGPRIEEQLRRTIKLFNGDPAGLLSEPIAVVVYIIIAIILIFPFLMKLWRRNHPAPSLLSANATRGSEPTDVTRGNVTQGSHRADGNSDGGGDGDG
jgi:putative tricarboxylic transport membrane protein